MGAVSLSLSPSPCMPVLWLKREVCIAGMQVCIYNVALRGPERVCWLADALLCLQPTFVQMPPARHFCQAESYWHGLAGAHWIQTAVGHSFKAKFKNQVRLSSTVSIYTSSGAMPNTTNLLLTEPWQDASQAQMTAPATSAFCVSISHNVSGLGLSDAFILLILDTQIPCLDRDLRVCLPTTCQPRYH